MHFNALEFGFGPHENGTNCTTGINTNKNHNIMKKKTFYEAPETELLVVKFEENFCYSPYGSNGASGGTMEVNELGERDEDLY